MIDFHSHHNLWPRRELMSETAAAPAADAGAQEGQCHLRWRTDHSVGGVMLLAQAERRLGMTRISGCYLNR
jgi:hypothetical protein